MVERERGVVVERERGVVIVEREKGVVVVEERKLRVTQHWTSSLPGLTP